MAARPSRSNLDRTDITMLMAARSRLQPTQHMHRLDRNMRLIKLYNAGFAIRVFDSTMLLFALSLGLNLTQLASLTLASYLIGMVADVPSSLWADRFGYRHALRLGAIGIVVSCAGTALFAHNFGQLLCWTTLSSASHCFIGGTTDAFARQNTDQTPGTPASLAYLVYSAQRYRTFALYVVASGGLAWLLVWLRPEDGPRWAFALQAIVVIPFFAASWWLTEPAHQPKAVSLPLRAYGRLWPLMAYGALMTGFDTSGYFLLQPLYRSLSLSTYWYPLLNIVLYGGMFVASCFTVAYVRRLSQFQALASLAVWTSLMLVLPCLLPRYWSFIALIPLMMQLALMRPITTRALMDQSSTFRATLLSVVGTVGALIGLAFDLVLGWVVDHTSVPMAFLIGLMLYGPLAVYLLYRLKKLNLT